MMLLEYALHTWMPKTVINKHQYIIFLLRSFMIETLFTLFLFCVANKTFFCLIVKTLTKKATIVTTSILSYKLLLFSTLHFTKQNSNRVKSFHYDESWNLSHSHIFLFICRQKMARKFNNFFFILHFCQMLH